MVTADSTAKSNSTATSVDKLSNSTASYKLITRVKLPVGVVPIPKMILPKTDKDDSSKFNVSQNFSINNNPDVTFNLIKNSGMMAKNIKNKNAPRQYFPWYKVKPGVQEIGDEPHIVKKLSEFDETDMHHGLDEKYFDYYKDLSQKHGAIHLDEGEEEDGEDVEDYHNNPELDKPE